MSVLAKDIMVTEFDTINQSEPIETAIKMIFKGRIRETGGKTHSLMVIDDHQQFVGIITMFDILYNLRPGILEYGFNVEDISWIGQIQMCKEELIKKQVQQVMSSEIVGALPDEHLMLLLNRMVKNKYQRLPIIQNSKPIGIVYIADIYFHLFARDGIVNQRKEVMKV